MDLAETQIKAEKWECFYSGEKKKKALVMSFLEAAGVGEL